MSYKHYWFYIFIWNQVVVFFFSKYVSKSAKYTFITIKWNISAQMSRIYRHVPLFVLDETDRTYHLRLFLKELIILQSCPPVVKGRWDKTGFFSLSSVIMMENRKKKKKKKSIIKHPEPLSNCLTTTNSTPALCKLWHVMIQSSSGHCNGSMHMRFFQWKAMDCYKNKRELLDCISNALQICMNTNTLINMKTYFLRSLF